MQWENGRPKEIGRVLTWNAAKKSLTVAWRCGKPSELSLGQDLVNWVLRPSSLEGVTVFEASEMCPADC